MYRWFTITMVLADSLFFAASRRQGQHGPIWKWAAAFAASQAVYGIFWLLGLEAWAFLSVPAGQAVCQLFDGIWGEREQILSELCLYLPADAILVPCICYGKEEIWQFAACFFLFLFCVVLFLGRRKESDDSLPGIYPENRTRDTGLKVLPCIILLPEAAILFVARPERVAEALLESGVFLMCYLLILWLQREIAGRLAAEEFNEAMGRWQQESRDYMNTIRSQRHDFNLHLHAISGLIGSREYEKCSAYVSRLVAEANEVNDIMPVNDAVVGSMLYNMREEARKKGSDIVYNITYDMRDIICNGFECNKIIGNLLQNAIDALQTPEDKAFGICLSIFKRRGNTVIVSENRFTGDADRIARVFEPGYSTKKGHEGIGLPMVLRTAKLYGGRVYPEFEEEKIRFVVNIPNRVRLEAGEETT